MKEAFDPADVMVRNQSFWVQKERSKWWYHRLMEQDKLINYIFSK
jgi:hypothetical protein